MLRISFQNEQPSSLDVFPGGSHDKVATAMCDYIVDEHNSRVIGLDGEFGSGKSSILTMLQRKLVDIDQKYKVWFFDCEQNYQGSIKSNFIELFTEELIAKVGSDETVRESLQDSRDRALGRQFTYTKNTISRVSSWALILVVSLFFSTSSFKELFAIAKLQDPVYAWMFVHIVSFLSPLLVLYLAHRKLKDTKVGDQPWSIFHLFKGGSDDTVTEKIKVAKEVTPIDLKRTLEDDLKLIGGLHYVVILDNLDRLPKDSLRAVWSDLEIFTWVSADNNLTVVVPFCSSKVAKYLAPEGESTYDSRDFISKKFPVVFRAPPIITAGWKDGFYQLWQNTYPDVAREVAEKCALLLQRHSPMKGKLVTPRLQKRFINDIATTSLTLGVGIDIVCIGAHLLLCKYEGLPLEEVIRGGGVSDAFKATHSSFDDKDLVATQKLLERHIGGDLETGWQIQFLQIHYLTNRKIAMAELIDEPLSQAIEENNGERFAELVSAFGFNDAFKRHLSGEAYGPALVRVLASASEKLPKEDFERVIHLLSTEAKAFQGALPQGDAGFFEALKTCRLGGLNVGVMESLKSEMTKTLRVDVNDAVEPETIEAKRARLKDYDHFVDALGHESFIFSPNNAAYFTHIFLQSEDLKVVSSRNFKFTTVGIESVHQHIIALPDSDEVEAISEVQRVMLLDVLNASRKIGQDLQVPMEEEEDLRLSQSLSSYPNNDGALFGLALSRKLPDIVITQLVGQPFEGRTVNQNAAVAVILLAANKFEELAKVEGLEAVVQTPVFKLLLRGTESSEPLIKGYTDSSVGQVVSKVWAWAIKNDAIWRLSHNYVALHFKDVAIALAPHGVDAQALFNWISGWQHNVKAEFDVLDTFDPEFVRKLLSSSDEQYKDFKQRVLEFYGSDDLGSEGWEPILLSASDNHNSLIEWSFTQEGFTLGKFYRTCSFEILKKIMMEQLSYDERPRFARSLAALVLVSDQPQKNLLGVELRNHVYMENSSADSAVWLLKSFGYLIVDIQPANTAEVGRLMAILNYLEAHGDEAGEVLTFLEGRAKQIASFTYSEQMREAMALAVAKLKKKAPKLYQAFSKKSIFKGLLRDILTSEKKAEKAKVEQEEEQTVDAEVQNDKSVQQPLSAEAATIADPSKT
ncbi:KAP family NTPase [Pseudomonas mosselii]|uniref:P-loop NTPase fold protein n=1 Tax=Pseudomonas mosselii TaxID=78327 RepID=UPI001FF738F4|nr:P-loop NTPase fold protein [Pseudomonas mosselii]UPF04849.1 KAP family NTPase [Pseudomonas mosselii]